MDTFYVSPTGKDSNDGKSEESAFQTLDRTRQAVSEVNDDMTGDIVVYLSDGVWELDETVTFGQNDSGINGYYIRYEAAPGASPVISGGKKLNNDWSEYETLDNGNVVYQIDLERDCKLRALYVNGERSYMAATENAIAAQGTYYIGAAQNIDDYEWTKVYAEDFEKLESVGINDSAIKKYSKSGNINNTVLNLVEEDGNRAIQIAHSANEDCGFEIPDTVYRNGMISYRIQFGSEHKFTHEWEALHMHGANKVIDNAGRAAWSGIKIAPHLNQTYFQAGTSGGNSGDDVNAAQNHTAFTPANNVWYQVKMMITDDGWYMTKIWEDGTTEPKMQWAVGSGIITGKENGTVLDPQGNTYWFCGFYLASGITGILCNISIVKCKKSCCL